MVFWGEIFFFLCWRVVFGFSFLVWGFSSFLFCFVGVLVFFFSELPDLMSFPSCEHPGWAASEICHREWEEEEGEPASSCSVPGPCLLSIPG